MRHILFCTLVLVTACKKDEKTAPAPEAKPTEAVATKPTEVVKSAEPPEPAQPAVAVPTASTLTVPLNEHDEVKLGCLGWSEKSNAIACVTGELDRMGDDVALSFINSTEPPLKLARTLDDALVKASNTALANYVAFDKPSTKLEVGKPTDVGGMTLKQTTKQTHPGGENQPPTDLITVTAACGGKTVKLFKREEEGLSVNVTYRAVSGGTFVEIKSHVGREGEYIDRFEAKLLDSGCVVK